MIRIRCKVCGFVLGELDPKVTIREVWSIRKRYKLSNVDFVIKKPIKTRVANLEDFFILVERFYGDRCPRCLYPLDFKKRKVEVFPSVDRSGR